MKYLKTLDVFFIVVCALLIGSAAGNTNWADALLAGFGGALLGGALSIASLRAKRGK